MTLGTLAASLKAAGALPHDAAAERNAAQSPAPGQLAAFQGGLKAGIHDVTAGGTAATCFDHS